MPTDRPFRNARRSRARKLHGAGHDADSRDHPSSLPHGCVRDAAAAGRPMKHSRGGACLSPIRWIHLGRSIPPHTASCAIATAAFVREITVRKSLGCNADWICPPFNRLALFAAAVTTVRPRRRSSSTTGSTMELGDDYRTFSSFDTSANHHHELRCFLPIFTGG